MADANVSKGRELALLVRTDDELTFEVIGGVRERGISFGNPVEEVTSSSTTGDYSESEWTGYSQATINISGVADKRTGTTDPATGFNITNFERLLDLATKGNRDGYFRIISTDPNFNFQAEGTFNITSIELSGSTPGLLNDTATLESGAGVTVSVGV
jgi:predicted secreted protein